MHVHDDDGRAQLSLDTRRPNPVGERSIGDEANAKTLEGRAPATEEQSQHTPAPQALDLHATFLEALRHRGFRQGRELEGQAKKASIDGSPQSFAAALAHLESRMGKI